MPKKPREYLYDTQLPMVKSSTSDENRSKPPNGGLSKIEMEFCFRYTACYNGTQAAIQAGYNPAKAPFIARALKRNPRVDRQIKLIENERLRKFRFEGDKFLAEQVRLASASVAEELFEVWVPPCRCCWGRNFEYQRTYSEFNEAFEAWMRMPDKQKRGQSTIADFGYGAILVYDEGGAKVPFDQRGGDGYDVEKPPNPECPNCRGRGNENEQGTLPYVKHKDWRDLSDTGKLLVAGVENSPRGLKILVRNQDAARNQLLAMLGRWFEFRASQGAVSSTEPMGFGVGLAQGVAGLITDDPRSLSDQELDSLLGAYGVAIDDQEQSNGE